MSWITTHHPVVPGFETPYHTVLVSPETTTDESAAQILMPGLWCGPAPPAIGMTVQIEFEDVEESDGTDFTLLGWRPAD